MPGHLNIHSQNSDGSFNVFEGGRFKIIPGGAPGTTPTGRQLGDVALTRNLKPKKSQPLKSNVSYSSKPYVRTHNDQPLVPTVAAPGFTILNMWVNEVISTTDKCVGFGDVIKLELSEDLTGKAVGDFTVWLTFGPTLTFPLDVVTVDEVNNYIIMEPVPYENYYFTPPSTEPDPSGVNVSFLGDEQAEDVDMWSLDDPGDLNEFYLALNPGLDPSVEPDVVEVLGFFDKVYEFRKVGGGFHCYERNVKAGTPFTRVTTTLFGEDAIYQQFRSDVDTPLIFTPSPFNYLTDELQIFTTFSRTYPSNSAGSGPRFWFGLGDAAVTPPAATLYPKNYGVQADIRSHQGNPRVLSCGTKTRETDQIGVLGGYSLQFDLRFTQTNHVLEIWFDNSLVYVSSWLKVDNSNPDASKIWYMQHNEIYGQSVRRSMLFPPHEQKHYPTYYWVLSVPTNPDADYGTRNSPDLRIEEIATHRLEFRIYTTERTLPGYPTDTGHVSAGTPISVPTYGIEITNIGWKKPGGSFVPIIDDSTGLAIPDQILTGPSTGNLQQAFNVIFPEVRE